jgi:hypothetical protein
MKNRPQYETLNAHGFPYIREAREIHELPHPDRIAAIEEATSTIEQLLGMKSSRRVGYGIPVFEAFMRRPDAEKHTQRALLMTQGCHLSLDLCSTYN